LDQRDPRFLGVEEVVELDRLYLEAFAIVDLVRACGPMGRHVSTPKLPSPLSEGIAALAVPRLLGPDFLAQSPRGRDDMRIIPGGRIAAVKGTGACRWISITETDRGADLLIWVDYSRRLVRSARTVDLWLFEGKVKSWATADRLTFEQATRCYGQEPKRVRVSLQRLRG
jgi:hypothetical protein